MTAPEPPPLGTWPILVETLRRIERDFARLFPLAFVPALVVSTATAILVPPVPEGVDPATALSTSGGWALAVATLLQFTVASLVTGVMSLAALDAVIGKRHAVGDYLAQTARHLGPILVYSVLIALGIALGAVFLVVPGLYVLARYFVCVPAIVFEDAGWRGLGRAGALTQGYRWPIVGATLALALIVIAVLVLGGLVAVAVVMVVGLLTGAGTATVPPVLAVFIDALFGGLNYTLGAIFTALIYARLREIKEGMSRADIAATID